MHLLIGIEQVHYSTAAVFRVPTERGGDVFMRIGRSNYRNEDTAVVVVDAQRFLDLWRMPGSSHDDVAHMPPETWPTDYKFNDAAKGFAIGHSNPVPLADVSCYLRTEKRAVEKRRWWSFSSTVEVVTTEHRILGFTNGVTRTIWLLHAGAPAFPVKCSTKEAPLLQQWAGIHDQPFLTVDKLVPQLSSHSHRD